MRRVVVTGLGMVTPLGCGVDATWTRILNGQSGARKIETFEVADLSSRIACVIPRGDGSDGTFDPLVGIEGAVRAVATGNHAGDPAGEIGDLKGLDLPGAALAVQDTRPGRVDAAAERRNHAQPRDDNPPHIKNSSPSPAAHNKKPGDRSTTALPVLMRTARGVSFSRSFRET